MRLRWPLFFIANLFSSAVLSYPHQEVLPNGARVSLVAQKLDSQTELTDINPTDQLFPPASTLKIVTALAAKLELGNEFTFKTKLESSSSDAVISFSGDPTLLTNDLHKMLTRAKKKWLEKNQW